MAACVYCAHELLPNTKRAHVIPSALGGRLNSRVYCCSDCNTAISPSENRLVQALRFVTAMVGVRRGDRRLAPHARVADATQGPIDVWGGIPKPVEQAPERVDGEGYTEFRGSAPDPVSLARQMAHVLRRVGKTPEDLEQGTGVSVGATQHSWFASGVTDVVVGDCVEHFRAFAKMPFELLAVRAPELAQRPELKPSARFIRDGEPHLAVRFDGVTLGPAGRVLRPPLHSCEVWTSGAYVIGRVVLFGAFPVTVPLAHVWHGSRFTAVHVVDPVEGRVLLDHAEVRDGPLPEGWPGQREDGFERAQHIQRLMEHLHAAMKAATERESRRRVEAAWHSELNGRAPSATDLNTLDDMLRDDRERRARRQDEVRPVDTAEFTRLVRSEYERLREDDGVE